MYIIYIKYVYKVVCIIQINIFYNNYYFIIALLLYLLRCLVLVSFFAIIVFVEDGI